MIQQQVYRHDDVRDNMPPCVVNQCSLNLVHTHWVWDNGHLSGEPRLAGYLRLSFSIRVCDAAYLRRV